MTDILTSDGKVWTPTAQISLPVTVASIDQAEVATAPFLPIAGGGCETTVHFNGVRFQTYETNGPDIAAAFRRLADRIEAAHKAEA